MDQYLGWVCYKDIISVTILMDLSLRNAPEDSPAGTILTPEWPALDVNVLFYLITCPPQHEYENNFASDTQINFACDSDMIVNILIIWDADKILFSSSLSSL